MEIRKKVAICGVAATVFAFIGLGSALGASKGYNHCVYAGSTMRGCTNGTWWQDGSSRVVYDRAYWRYVSGPNSIYHVSKFDNRPGSRESRRSANTKSTKSVTAKYQFTPERPGVVKKDWIITADVCEDESFSPDNCRDGGESLVGRP